VKHYGFTDIHFKSHTKTTIHRANQSEAWNKLPWIRRMVRSRSFNTMCGLIIALNCLFIGIQVDARARDGPDDGLDSPTFRIESVFCVIFLAEFFIRSLALRKSVFTREMVWHLFDGFVLFGSLMEVVVKLMTTGPRKPANANVFRMVRMLRFARTARVIRIMRLLHELRLMVDSVIHSVSVLLWAIVLLGMIIYMVAIIITQAVTDHCLNQNCVNAPRRSKVLEYFGTVPQSMYTLFQGIFGGVSWAEFAIPLRQVGIAYELLFVFFIAINALVMLNVVTAVVLDSAMQSAQHDKEMVIEDQLMAEKKYAADLRELFLEADADDTGYLTQQELKTYLEDDRVQAYLKGLDLEVSEALELFHLLDTDGNGTVDIDEFSLGAMRLKGGAKNVDIATLMFENKRMIATIGCVMKQLHEKLDQMKHDNLQQVKLNEALFPQRMRTSCQFQL